MEVDGKFINFIDTENNVLNEIEYGGSKYLSSRPFSLSQKKE